jgi:aminoglycoside phosphotransferase family enzyme/predicted kinase
MTDAHSQADVLAFLMAPATHGGATPELITTAQSHLILLPDRVYKLKRPVQFAHLDYGTLARRKACAREELAVNAVAGALYRRVVPVTRSETGLTLGGSGTPVEWLVEMDRFASGDRFDELLEAGGLTPALLDQALDTVAALHRDAPVATDPEQAQRPGATLANLARDLAGCAVPSLQSLVAQWTGLSAASWTEQASEWRLRFETRRVRRVHGDLHLANLCLYQGRPVPFDAIDFNPPLATIDVLYDLAYLLMDLAERGHADLANRALNRWLETSGDYAGLGLLPLYLSMRAAIRSMIWSLEGKPADAYLHFAVDCLARATPPVMVAIGGLSGAGKTTLARAVVPSLGGPVGAIHLRSDGIRKRLMGVAPETRLGPDAYTPAVTARVYGRLVDKAATVLSHGQSVIVDAVSLKPGERLALEQAADLAQAAFAGVWLDLDIETASQRLEARVGDASDATSAVRYAQAQLDPGPIAWTRLSASQPLADLVSAVQALLPG